MPKRSVPFRINKPTRVQEHLTTPTAPTVADVGRGSVFAGYSGLQPVEQVVQIEPSTPAAIDISRATYGELITDDPNVQKVLLPEYVDYYTTALLWLRIIALKPKLRQQRTDLEERVATITSSLELAVPEPLMAQLRVLGSTQTIIRERLYPKFPELPHAQVGGFGGYYGALGALSHNLYEEIPCLGVTAEAVRHAVSNANPGPYASSLATPELVPNENLLGFRTLGYRRGEAKSLAFSAGITDVAFREDIADTALNLKFITSISGYLATTKSFKVTTTNISGLAENGSVIQAMTTASPPNTVPVLPELEGDLAVTSGFADEVSLVGASLMFCPQLNKTNATRATAHTWACVANPPQLWINNRNARRNSLPVTYTRQAFRAASVNAEQARISMIRNMLLTKR